MRLRNLIWLLSVFAFVACSFSDKQIKTIQKTDANGFTYNEVTNDPLNARIYKLDNGLTVFLTQNTDEPRVACLVGVASGSTSDPIETTGLAHYFEHMMFKGTPRLGTVDWEKEKVQIEKLEQLFEAHRNETDPEKKKEIYAEIDQTSLEAAQYVATNEYDKLMSSIGAKATNAGTSFESTVYMNDVPVNELEKWAKIESERFHGIVLRLFHTELETVYEEFNMYNDRDSERSFTAMMQSLFPNHPYGRDIIGFPEHIKNPSMINIKKFFDTYYVPNNMAVSLSGDIDFESTIQLINKYFGDLQPKELPENILPKEDPIEAVITREVVGPEPENLIMSWRFDGVKSEDEPIVAIIDMLLSNSQAGLIDLDLAQAQKVLYAGCSPYFLKDYGLHYFYGAPLQGQTLEEVKDLLIGEVEKIKEGDFDDWMIDAVINNLKLNKIRQQESNMSRASELVEDFTNGIRREDAVAYFSKLEKITKADIMEFAKANYNDNYVIVYKRQGANEGFKHVDKPAITPVPINRDLQSDFATEVMQMPTEEIKPVFVDFDEEIQHDKIQDGCDMYYIKNESNDLFSLRYIIDMGSWHDLKFELAVGYLELIGTNKYSAPELQKELYKNGLELNVSTGAERSIVTISGLSSSFDKGVELMEHILNNAKADSAVYVDYVARILKNRQDEKADQQTILFDAMWDYGQYGPENPKKYILSEDELLAVNPAELTELIKQISTYEHKIFYYGPKLMAEVKTAMAEKHIMPGELAEIPAAVKFEEPDNVENNVYLVDYDISQANILLVSNADVFTKEMMPFAQIYNEYYGSGLSSVVYQEIRESKALAYSAMSLYRYASTEGRRNSVLGYLGTQADKLPIATKTLQGLLNEMPKAEAQYNMSREAIVKKINSERITKSQIFFTWQRNMDRGIDYDIRKDIYDAALTMDINAFEANFNQYIKGKKFNYLILGNKKLMNKKTLSSLGKVKELSLEEIFGY